MDRRKWSLVLQFSLLLISWIGDVAAATAADSSLEVEEYLVEKENKVRLLASDALRLALDREECGTAITGSPIVRFCGSWSVNPGQAVTLESIF